MSDARSALGYLVRRSTINRIARQASRVRQPRYAIAVLMAVGYFTLIFVAPRPPHTAMVFGATGTVVAAAAIAAYLMSGWLVRTSASGLAFTPAEVQFLLAGPVAPRQLVGYRVWRSQLVILISAVIWTYLLRSFDGNLPPLLRFASAWALVTVLSLHGLAIDLMRIAPVTGVRLLVFRLMQGIAIAILAVIVMALLPLLHTTLNPTAAAIGGQLDAVLTHGAVSLVLRPFSWVVAPFAAITFAAWLPAFGVVLVIVAAHLGWVLLPSIDIADRVTAASAKAALRRARFLSHRTADPVVTRRRASQTWLPLAPTGMPALAIAWKNTLALARSSLTAHLGLAALIAIMLFQFRHVDPVHPGMALLMYAGISAMLLFLGPRTIRNDLRQDLLHLAQLRTYPLTGASLVAGEIVVPTVVLTLAQMAIMAFGVAMTWNTIVAGVGGAVTAVPLIVVGLAGLLALNAMNVSIQNALALLFPSWVRLGADSAGIEAMGQNLLVTFGSMLALLLTMLLPVAAAALVGLGAQTMIHSPPVIAVAAGAAIGIAILGMEVVALIQYLGGVFDRTDPGQIV